MEVIVLYALALLGVAVTTFVITITVIKSRSYERPGRRERMAAAYEGTEGRPYPDKRGRVSPTA